MKGCTQQEILGVLAHELGHWSLSHTLKLLGISQVLLPPPPHTHTHGPGGKNGWNACTAAGEIGL